MSWSDYRLQLSRRVAEDSVTFRGRNKSPGHFEISLAWSPEKSGKHELRTFALSDLTQPQIYSQIWVSEVTISESALASSLPA